MRTTPRAPRGFRPQAEALEAQNPVSSLVPGLESLAAMPLFTAEMGMPTSDSDLADETMMASAPQPTAWEAEAEVLAVPMVGDLEPLAGAAPEFLAEFGPAPPADSAAAADPLAAWPFESSDFWPSPAESPATPAGSEDTPDPAGQTMEPAPAASPAPAPVEDDDGIRPMSMGPPSDESSQALYPPRGEGNASPPEVFHAEGKEPGDGYAFKSGGGTGPGDDSPASPPT